MVHRFSQDGQMNWLFTTTNVVAWAMRLLHEAESRRPSRAGGSRYFVAQL